jgi:UPF0716 family protein affecting phage T7 exclusion
MVAAILLASLALAVALPVVAAFRGARLRTSVARSAAPAVIVAAGALASLATTWGGQSAESSEDVSNSYALFVAAVLALMAGVIGDCLAALITRVRRGNEWSRRV